LKAKKKLSLREVAASGNSRGSFKATNTKNLKDKTTLKEDDDSRFLRINRIVGDFRCEITFKNDLKPSDSALLPAFEVIFHSGFSNSEFLI
jgi:hypothetical protein